MQVAAQGAASSGRAPARVVDTFDSNGNETLTWHGPDDGLVYGFLARFLSPDKLCAALGALRPDS